MASRDFKVLERHKNFSKLKLISNNFNNRIQNILLLTKFRNYKTVKKLREDYTFSELFEGREKYIIIK